MGACRDLNMTEGHVLSYKGACNGMYGYVGADVVACGGS